MPSETRWTIEATFTNRELAKQAASMMVAMRPIYLHLAAQIDEREVWSEYVRGGDATELRI